MTTRGHDLLRTHVRCLDSRNAPQGIYRSLVGGVTEMIATTDGLAVTQDALLATSGALLEGERISPTAFIYCKSNYGGIQQYITTEFLLHGVSKIVFF